MARYLEIARRVVAEQDSLQPEELGATRVVPELPVADPYAERMRAALRKINQSSYPAGMMRWIEIANPVAYAELTSDLPDEIHRLWTERAPLEQFETVLSRLVSLHEECCRFCRASQKDSISVPKTSEQNFGAPRSIGDAE